MADRSKEQARRMVRPASTCIADEGTWLVKERVDADFEASYAIDDTVDPQKIEAGFQDGVLTVTLNLKEAVKPRRIAVKTG